jgi:hypothetical protein
VYETPLLPSGDGAVGEAGNVRLALLHDGHGEHGQVTVNNASAHRLQKVKKVSNIAWYRYSFYKKIKNL